MSNNSDILSATDQGHAQQPQSQQHNQQQIQQPGQVAEVGDKTTGYVGAGPSITSTTTTSSTTPTTNVNTELPSSVVMPAVAELVAGRVSPRSMLTVVPEQKRQKGVSTRRAFQPRRRSRACDQCRTRKTKVRTPMLIPISRKVKEAICLSCISPNHKLTRAPIV